MSDTSNLSGNIDEIEEYFNLPHGSFSNIPSDAREPAFDAILKVREMESKSLFRPGLYYIVLADLCANTTFNVKYGDRECDIRTQWFHTAVIKSIGEVALRNYAAFNKTIGDASLLIFSSFLDVVDWSDRLTKNLDALSEKYVQRAREEFFYWDAEELDALINDFRLRARRVAHLGEVSYKGSLDPLSLAVSQTFKIEKFFHDTNLGCTQSVASAIKPKLLERRLFLIENQMVDVPGFDASAMTYYVMHERRNRSRPVPGAGKAVELEPPLVVAVSAEE